MAPSKDSEVLEESAESGSNDTTSNEGSSAEPKDQNESSELTTSCPAVLEPSEDDPLFGREKIRRPRKTYRAIMRSFNSREVFVNSDDPSNDGENGRIRACSLACIYLFNRYKTFAVKFRNSKFIYIVQILLTLLPVSAIMMGLKYVGACPGAPSLTLFNGVTALFSLFLIAFWICIRCCDPDVRPCEGLQKGYILIFFVLVSVFLEIEILSFSKLSPSFNPSSTNYCNKAFYDYFYYKFIAALGSMLLVVLLYFPDCSSFAEGVYCDIAGSCYQRYTDEDEL